MALPSATTNMKITPFIVKFRAANIKQISAIECSAPHKINAGMAMSVVKILVEAALTLCWWTHMYIRTPHTIDLANTIYKG